MLHRAFTAATLFVLVSTTYASDTVRDDNLLFGAVVDGKCDETTFRAESPALAAWAAKFAVNAVVGLASSMLDAQSETKSIVRSSAAPGYLYRWDFKKKAWLPDGACVRFWLGRQRSNVIGAADEIDYGIAQASLSESWKVLATRWRMLGLIEQPYLYGEIRITTRPTDNLLVLQPVVLFARKPPEAGGIFRQSTRLAVALDLKALGADSNLASQLIELPDVSGGPMLVRGPTATLGLASAWGTIPAPPKDPAKEDEREAGPFTAHVVFTSASDGTLFSKVLASTFKSQKDDLAAALTPESKAQRAQAQQTAVSDAFDAVSVVLSAQADLDKASDQDNKPKLALVLQKAQYLANLKLQAAGLPPRYAVTGP